jgi:5-methylcytosine-specific restriction endonuclease McrA
MLSDKKRKLKLFALNPHCHWCGKLTRLYKHNQHKKTPLDAATLDHLRSRYNPERLIPSPDKEQTVLACWECNHKRGEQETKETPPEELHRRSKMHTLEAV